MTCIVYAFPEDREPAQRLADMLGTPLHLAHPHTFPDGESRPTIAAGARTALLYRGLARPDPKVVPTLLLADALRRGGAERVVLAAPYLPYLRQDRVFHPGEPLSRDVFARLLAPAFDRIVTVQPHLHRTRDLGEIFGPTPVTVLSAAALLATAIGRQDDPLIVGPDAESEPLAADIAQQLGAPHVVFAKHRLGDADVMLGDLALEAVAGRRAALVDDICSSGATLAAALTRLRDANAASIEVFVVHALFRTDVADRLRALGASRIVASDSCVPHRGELHLAGLLADALQEELARAAA